MGHTKGKWDISTHADNEDIVIRSEKGIIANLTGDTWDDLVPTVEQEANARLMVAAPDLLEACKKISNSNYGVAIGDLEYLNNAIRKAEGK